MVTSAAPTHETTGWAPYDPLGEALHFLQMSGVFYTRSELTAPWGLALPPLPDTLMFHVVTAGRCWLEVGGELPALLQPGDFALVPHGAGHVLLSEPGAPAADLFDLPREEVGARYELLAHGDGGEATILICGAVRFDQPAARHLAAQLPPIIYLESWRSPQMEWMQSTLRLIAAEAGAMRPGGETIITRLADILVIQAIRAWLAEEPSRQPGWLGALHDPEIGPALLLMQREPERPWTVASLAAAVAMSRSAFAARFKEVVGESPLRYLTRWRMQVADTLLRDENLTLGELADRLGYRSEAAFSRAFKRFNGLSPGAARRRHRQAAAANSLA